MPDPSKEICYRLPKELEDRIRIEMFSDTVTRALYSNRYDPIGLTKDSERYSLCSLLAREYGDLEVQLGTNLSGKSHPLLVVTICSISLYALQICILTSRHPMWAMLT